MFISAGVLISKCCHQIIMLDGDDEHYKCTRCMKPCEADGTLGEWSERQRKEHERDEV